jgi:SAM-dependent methyltransferase
MEFNALQYISGFKNPESFSFEQVPCYICGETDCKPFLQGEDDLTGKEGKFLYVICGGCGLVYQNPRLTVSHIKEFYDSEYIAHRKKKDWGALTPLYEWAMSKHDRDKEKLVRRFVNIDSTTKVMDVGCAVGTFLLHLNKKYGCSISGVDFKEGLSYPGFEKINFYEGLFYDQDIAAGEYDLVTMWHFLEHCYDPNRSLKMAHKVLKKDGRMIIEVPRLDSVSFKLFGSRWPGVQAPQHTALYNKESFCRLIEKQGFVIEKYLPYGAFPPYFYLFTGTYFKLFGKGLKLDRIIAPYFLGQFLLTPILMFQKQLNLSMQTAVCRKK